MIYGAELYTAPTSEPVSLDLLSLHCRVNGDDEVALLDHYRTAARELWESMTDTSLMPQTWKVYLDHWQRSYFWYVPTNTPEFNYPRSGIYLPKNPVNTISSVQYYDANDTLQTLSSGKYVLDQKRQPARLSYTTSMDYPTLSLQNHTPKIIITMTTGYSNADAVPNIFKQAIFAQASTWYESRSMAEVSEGFLKLANRYRMDMVGEMNHSRSTYIGRTNGQYC
jgi:hypothetical protein